jgi:ribonuclease P protein component
MSDEAHLSAEQSRARAPARLPVADGDPGRAQCDPRAPRTRPQVAVGLNPPSFGILGRRADFLAANSGKRVAMPGFVLLVKDRQDGDPAMRIGFTVTKKIGGAVVRNRMKRRFRALAREMLPERGIAGADHVLIGRAGGVERDFSALRQELGKALDRAAR